MDINCDRDILTNAVTICQRAIGGKTTSVLYEGIHIRTDGEFLILNCTDREIGIESRINANISEEGSMIVNARLFGEMVRKLPDNNVRLFSNEDTKLNIRCGEAYFELYAISNEIFPPFPELKKGEIFEIDQFLFKRMLQQTCFAISLDEGRRTLTGLLLESGGNVLTAVAVDGFRMALRRHEIIGFDGNGNGGDQGNDAVSEDDHGNVSVSEGDHGNVSGSEDVHGNDSVSEGVQGNDSVSKGVRGSGNDDGGGDSRGDVNGGGNGGSHEDGNGGGNGDSREDGNGNGSDASRGSRNENEKENGMKNDINVIIPGKTVNELVKIIPSTQGKLSIYGTKKQIVIEFENCRVSTGIIEGEFFNYKYIVPEQTVTDFTLKTAEMREAIERASLIITTEFIIKYPVLLCVAGDVLKIKSTSNLGHVEEKVSINTEGKDMEVAFNPRFLIEALRSIDEEIVKISFTSEVGQCLMRSTNSDGFVHLILPVKRM